MSALDFHASKPLTLGIELEWQIVDPKTSMLRGQSIPLLKAIAETNPQLSEQFKPESVRNMIEINSRVHENVEMLLHELYQIQDQVHPILKDLNLMLIGGGTYAGESGASQKIYPDRRYEKLQRIYGFLLKRFPVYGQHIHIGCDTPANMLYLTHAFADYVPHFIALAAASPFFIGADTQFDCFRLNIMSIFPTGGTIPWITNWKAFEAYFSQLCQFRLINSMKDLHWDIRPKPEFGTVELRICDSPLTLKKAAALAAYAQALSAYLLDTRPALEESVYISYKFNRFSAMRYGLNAKVLDLKTHIEKPLNEVILATLEIIKPYAKSLGGEALLAILAEECQTKRCDAYLLREAFRKTKDLQSVIAYAKQAWYQR